jgi:predicted metalloprotease
LFIRWLDMKEVITQDDLDEAWWALGKIGDPYGYKPWKPGAHGSGRLRQAWFKAGFEKYNVGVCNSVFRVPKPSFVEAQGGAAYAVSGLHRPQTASNLPT